MPTFATPGPIAATVQVAGARVRITASDRTDTAVLVEPLDKTSRSHTRVADKTRVDIAPGRLSVRTTAAGEKDGSIAVTIDLPTGSSLVAYLAHSVIQADGPLGDCELHMASGRVTLDHVDALHANTAAGDVTVRHVAGPATIAAGAGQVRIGHAAGDLEHRGGGGGLDLGRADGRVTAATAKGAVRIGRLTRGPADLTTGSGHIEVGVDAGTAVTLDADSERGSVRYTAAASSAAGGPGGTGDGARVRDAASAAEGAGGTGDGVRVRARTRHGDIVIRRAPDSDQDAPEGRDGLERRDGSEGRDARQGFGPHDGHGPSGVHRTHRASAA